MATQKERSSSNGSPGTTPTPPPASGLQTEEGTATRPRATSSETPANQAAAFDPDMMEKFFSFMSFYEQYQQGAPAQSNNNNNNNATPMSLDEDRDPTGGLRGDRAFASAADEADWDKQNVDEASEEAGPLPYCSVDAPMDDESPRESANAEVFYHFADNGYVTPAEVNTNEAERIGPNFIPDPEAGDKAAYPADTTLLRYTQSGLQIFGLVTAVHGTEIPKEPATVQQALGGEHRDKWREAMDKELKALEERNTWKVVPIGMARNKTILAGKHQIPRFLNNPPRTFFEQDREFDCWRKRLRYRDDNCEFSGPILSGAEVARPTRDRSNDFG
ncbi:unnamed protein product [Closterium sp. NIES-53]